jgi:hypothetical protein
MQERKKERSREEDKNIYFRTKHGRSEGSEQPKRKNGSKDAQLNKREWSLHEDHIDIKVDN